MAKVTNVTKDTFLKTFENNGENVSNACEVAKINRRTYYRLLEKCPKFKQAVEDIKGKSNDKLVVDAKKGLGVNLKRNKQSAIEYVLNNKTSGEYTNTVKNEITGKVEHQVKYIIEKTYEGEDGKPKDNSGQVDP